MKKAAIFDLDGTLLNTLTDLAVSCNHALEVYGYPTHEVEAYKLFVGNGVYNLVKRILPADAQDEEIRAKIKAEFDAYYAAHTVDYTKPYDGIEDMLGRCREKGIKMIVVSNKAHNFVVQLIESIFPGVFDVILGQRDDVPKKPDPTAVFEALDRVGVSAKESIYVGDSGVDMQTGKNAGCYTIGVSWGFRAPEELRENGADAIVGTPQEILGLL
ncbi:HAD family hydrolase [Zongyangia hominis]|uniref:HAD-IIIA family hydrolase n=1 Tax=Zongyangia hominis TaxID=2763677 RepID=A0A926E841_9FIRM|nr:HAD-IIIA family hydrolase [Zongyangia hominis]MBC8569615.1 HAD-IIIA family hydrolase [Zongyangia hominis]